MAQQVAPLRLLVKLVDLTVIITTNAQVVYNVSREIMGKLCLEWTQVVSQTLMIPATTLIIASQD